MIVVAVSAQLPENTSASKKREVYLSQRPLFRQTPSGSSSLVTRNMRPLQIHPKP
ncbi:hypothetical protein SBC2_01420 [Caballeronia sp. SBC2]|nr:hypothetical protein SBC2_01420 [Caballeronia sp. SBC2]